VPAAPGVFGTVGQQVVEDLGEPGEVGVQEDGLGRERDGELVASFLDEWLHLELSA